MLFSPRYIKGLERKIWTSREKETRRYKRIAGTFSSFTSLSIGDSTESITSAIPCRRIRIVVRFGFLNAILLTDYCDFLEKFNIDIWMHKVNWFFKQSSLLSRKQELHSKWTIIYQTLSISMKILSFLRCCCIWSKKAKLQLEGIHQIRNTISSFPEC